MSLVHVEGVTEFSTVCAQKAKKMLLLSHLKAPLIEMASTVRAPVRVSAVVDRSGSMRGEKIQLMKETLQFVVSELGENDEFGIVAYDNNVIEVQPLLPMTQENKEKSAEAIASIGPGGATDLHGGLMKGLQQVGHCESTKTVTSVWLFTDGVANCGTTDPSKIVNSLLGRIKEHTTVFTFGFGSQHNETLLNAIAEAGQGMYYFLENTESIPLAFSECLGGLLSVVGQQVRLVVDCAPGVSLLSVLSKQLDQKVEGNTASLRLKDLYAEEERDVVIEIEVTPTEVGRQTVATLELTYADTSEGGAVRQVTAEAVVDRVEADVDEEEVLSEQVDKHRNRILATEALKNAQQSADRGHLDKARAEMKECVARINKSKSRHQKLCKDLVVDVEECLKGMEQYTSHGRKLLTQTTCCHTWQKPSGLLG
eukprot:Sspe_Gene.95343::Locus_67642_Transcript_1_1_Confidence_1.000_Length_1323::g.95343::m.95343